MNDSSLLLSLITTEVDTNLVSNCYSTFCKHWPCHYCWLFLLFISLFCVSNVYFNNLLLLPCLLN